MAIKNYMNVYISYTNAVALSFTKDSVVIKMF